MFVIGRSRVLALGLVTALAGCAGSSATLTPGATATAVAPAVRGDVVFAWRSAPRTVWPSRTPLLSDERPPGLFISRGERGPAKARGACDARRS